MADYAKLLRVESIEEKLETYLKIDIADDKFDKLRDGIDMLSKKVQREYLPTVDIVSRFDKAHAYSEQTYTPQATFHSVISTIRENLADNLKTLTNHKESLDEHEVRIDK